VDDRDSRGADEQLERLRVRCWELEVALDWYLQRIHQLEAAIGAVDGSDEGHATGAALTESSRPRLVASGDDAAERHFARIAQYETELRAADAASSKLSLALNLQARTAAERLAMLEVVAHERDVQARAAEERLAALTQLAHELELQSDAARKRLTTIERLQTERAAEAKIAAESLRERDATIEVLVQERDLQTAAAAERLAMIEELVRQRDGDS
jgi:hypothetical protein